MAHTQKIHEPFISTKDLFLDMQEHAAQEQDYNEDAEWVETIIYLKS